MTLAWNIDTDVQNFRLWLLMDHSEELVEMAKLLTQIHNEIVPCLKAYELFQPSILAATVYPYKYGTQTKQCRIRTDATKRTVC